MAGLFALSVDPAFASRREFFKNSLYWGTSFCQHLSGEHSGLASYDRSSNGSDIVTDSKAGLFAPNFKERMDSFVGTEAIGCCGPAEEPFYVKSSKIGSFSACFCGNIGNCTELIEDFIHGGHILKRNDDIVVISTLIGQGKNILDGIRWMNKKVKGAYCLLLLTSEGIYAVRSPDAHWPLVIGNRKKDGKKAVVVSSESVGFDNLDFEICRDLKPGEVVLLKNGTWESKDILPGQQVQECAFYGVYTGSPSVIVQGLPATQIRKQLGAVLARQDIVDTFTPHIVMGVPDSGRFHAIGYHQEWIRQINLEISQGKVNMKWVPFYDEHLIKYFFVRSYLAPTQKKREEKAHYKIVITSETIEHIIQMLKKAGLTFIANDIMENKRIIIVVCDDSIVRGSQVASNLVPKIKLIFEKEIAGIDIKAEIHLRISYPQLLSHCPWGKTTKEGETLAERLPEKKDRINELGVDGLEYNTINDLVTILGRPREELCIDCCLRRE